MKVICKKTWYCQDNSCHCGECAIIKSITIDKIYDTLPNPSSNQVYRIIDDRGRQHDVSKQCLIPIRDINLDKLLDNEKTQV
jgi:hypothetical protein